LNELFAQEERMKCMGSTPTMRTSMLTILDVLETSVILFLHSKQTFSPGSKF
jgi:hypothetical protein